MEIIAFLFRMVLRLTLWAFALVGILIVMGVLVWLDVRRVYPDMSGSVQLLNWQAESGYQGLEYGASCEAVIVDLNRYAALGSGSAYIAAAALNESGECGQIDGGDVNVGLIINRASLDQSPDRFQRVMQYRNRLFHLVGLAGDTGFWRDFQRIEHCDNLFRVFDHEAWKDYADGSGSYREIRLARFQDRFECGRQKYELGLAFINSDDAFVRNRALSLILHASWEMYSEAEWWDHAFSASLDPDRYEVFLLNESDDSDLYPQCRESARLSETYRYEYAYFDRRLAARGQADATDRWLASGIPFGDHDYWDCAEEISGREGANSDRWRDGYDTPFWYAVHAIRIRHEVGLSHLAAIEADLGEACMALASDIAEGLRPILPGPPVDDPALRALILSSIDCQPVELRDPAEYWNGEYARVAEGEYLPPEAVYVLPSFEPVFRRVAE